MSRILFFFGLLTTIGLSILIIWPDFEALRFQRSFYADKPLSSLRCPNLITVSHPDEISISVENTLARPVRLLVQSIISSGPGSYSTQEKQEVFLDPEQSEKLAWEVDSEDAIYGRMVLARVYVARNGSMPSMQKSCGAYVLPISFLSGQFVLVALSLIGLVALVVGAYLQIISADSKRKSYRAKRLTITFLTTLTIVTYWLGIFEQTIPAIIGLFLMVIALLALIARFEG